VLRETLRDSLCARGSINRVGRDLPEAGVAAYGETETACCPDPFHWCLAGARELPSPVSFSRLPSGGTACAGRFPGLRAGARAPWEEVVGPAASAAPPGVEMKFDSTSTGRHTRLADHVSERERHLLEAHSIRRSRPWPGLGGGPGPWPGRGSGAVVIQVRAVGPPGFFQVGSGIVVQADEQLSPLAQPPHPGLQFFLGAHPVLPPPVGRCPGSW